MKKQLLTLLILLLCFSAGLLKAQNIPEVLYYKFDGTGTTVPNYASAPPPGTNTANIMGAVTQGGSGICHGTLIGSGNASSTDYLNTNWAPNIGAGSWTISFRTSGISTNSTLYYIFGDANTNSFRCFTNGIAGSTNWVIRGGGLTDTYINGGAQMTPTMCTFVYDNTLNTVQGYLNGVLVTTVAQVAVNLTGAGPLKVMGYGTNVGAPAGGLMDEFRFYSHALTAAEVLELYNPYAIAGFLGPDSHTCPGTATELDLVWPTSTVLWSDGSTADSLLVYAADTFAVTISGACGSGTDSIVYISDATADTINPTACGSYLSPSGNTYTISGQYNDTIPNAVGCDSLININLIVNSPSSNSINPFVCAVNYTAPSGAVFSTSGTYMDTIPNMIGCDSLITINLSLNQSTSSSLSTTSCGAYMAPSGAIHNASGTFNDTIPNMSGCDSVITINLTVNNTNIGVTQTGSNGQGLSANAVGATYQWIDCNTMNAIVGETNQTYLATSNGSYAVIVTQNSCSDTSACFVVAGLGINQNTLAELVKLFPNPTTGTFTISLGSINESFTLELINNVGQVLKTAVFANTNLGTFEIEGTSGLYFVRITNSQGEKVILRIIKE